MKRGKERPLYRDIMMIPVQLLIDGLLIGAGILIDSRSGSAGAQGHPFPAFTVLAAAVAFIATAIVLVRALAGVIRKLTSGKH